MLQNLNIIDKYIDLSLDKKLLFEKQNLLLQSNNRTFISYTDGSVRDLSKSTALSTFGSTLYNENMNFILEIVSNYEHSISVAKSETLAVLITLLILPRYSIIKIFTDSAIVVDNFRKIKILLPNLTSRQFFKIPNLNNIWKIIFEIIDALSLTVNIHKVDAHSTNIYNNYVDNIVTNGYNNYSQHGLNINLNNLQVITYLPYWNDIPIETNLRKFLKLYTNTRDLEKFLNLNRNQKYRKLNVNWEITFSLLQGSQSSRYTDFKETKLKQQKVHFLIEEIATIEQVKYSLYSLYKHRKCPFCNLTDETFNHVWECSERSEEIFILVHNTKQILLDCINDKIENRQLHIEDIDIPSLDLIWDNVSSDNKFTFIDLIKGIIPLELSEFVNTKINNSQKTKEIFYNYRDISFNLIKLYWNTRCDKNNEIDISLGITKKKKKENFGLESYTKIRVPQEENQYFDAIGLQEQIKFGGKVISYYNNCVPR